MSLVVIAIPVEGPVALWGGLKAIAEERGTLVAPLLILFPGTIAFLMTASEFALLQRTSVVTLSIAGIFKEAVTISAAALVFGDTMTPINILGLLVTLAAIGAYNWIKISNMRQKAQTDVHLGRHDADGSSPPPSAILDDRDDDEGEETGLLRQTIDADETASLFTNAGNGGADEDSKAKSPTPPPSTGGAATGGRLA